MKKCKILDVNVCVSNLNEAVSKISENIDKLRGRYVCFSNVHTLITAYDNIEYRNVQNSADYVFADGNPLAVYSRNHGFKDAGRVMGPEFMWEMLKLSEQKGYTNYFYGSTPETIKKLKENLNKNFPNLKISGMTSPAFKKTAELESEEFIEKINSVKPDFFWVGLGAPKQETWMYLHKNKINSVMFGVGAAFDYHAGNIKQAPKWMKEHSLEWLYRLVQNPKKLFKRYFYTNIKWIWLTNIRRK